MPEINANIVVQPYNIDINLTQPGITVTPDVTSLNIYAVGGTNGQPSGNVGDLQYYAANGFAGVPSNVANYTGGNLNLNVNKTKITGGTNGYVLQTDGAGNISWTAQTGGGGNGSPGGSNTQIQFNDNGLFGGSTGFTFNKTSNLVSMPGALTIAGTFTGVDANLTGNLTAVTVTANLNGSATTAGTVTANAQPNITSLGNLVGLNVFGTMFASALRTSDTEIALGLDAGLGSQGNNAIAVGVNAGYANQGANSIAIGAFAAPNNQFSNTIVLNATGTTLNTAGTDRFYVNPIRNANTANLMYYNTSTKEVTYGDPVFANTSLSGTTTITGNTSISGGTLSIQQAKEKLTANSTGSTGTINYDLLTSAILLKTANATGNFTLNFRGNSSVTLDTVLDSNQSMTCSFINTNGVTPYVPTQLQIDGANIVPLWTGNTAGPGTGTPIGKDMYVFNIMKTAANTYTVFASRTGYA